MVRGLPGWSARIIEVELQGVPVLVLYAQLAADGPRGHDRKHRHRHVTTPGPEQHHKLGLGVVALHGGLEGAPNNLISFVCVASLQRLWVLTAVPCWAAGERAQEGERVQLSFLVGLSNSEGSRAGQPAEA